MTPAVPAGYAHHVVSLPQHAGLACRFLKPADFQIADLPPDEPDFARGPRFLPLAVAVAPIGPMVFTVAARPSFTDGTVSQWLDYICREENYPHAAITETRLGPLPGVTCDAAQQADGVTMKMRFILLEDDGRLFQLTAMAPEIFWASALEKMAPMLASFELRETRGTNVPLFLGARP